MVIGAVQGTDCFGAAYEFRFNTAYQLRKAGLNKRVPLTYVSAEPFLGRPVVAAAPGLADAKGFVPVHDTYQAITYPNIHTVGVAAAVTVPWTTAIPVGVSKTGFPTEVQARVAAANVADRIRGEEQTRHQSFGDSPAVCVMDAGSNGVMILADRQLPPRKAGVLLPRPQARVAKLALEKYFLWKARNGHVRLP
ncbi:NAD(P)/FAD-dependent oxidoreductase [Actinomadura sediminis]|uniref:Uncharacterized protein n=1 Tax=Actinomadura sediminis TaxID=1038904 RepID=A0ABW3EIC9_9ACTN